LIVSGDTAAERLREVNAGGYQLVHKPVQPAMLRAFLRNARNPRRAS
jgi:DNA-binding response OmpR family regulator